MLPRDVKNAGMRMIKCAMLEDDRRRRVEEQAQPHKAKQEYSRRLRELYDQQLHGPQTENVAVEKETQVLSIPQ